MSVNNKKAILIIFDGVGYSDNKLGNVMLEANLPNINGLLANYPKCILQASGLAVGLPEGQMGNSEVGHLSIGAGRVVLTGLTKINKEVEEGTFLKNEAFLKALKHVEKNKSKLHIMGLVSHGGVHSSFEHILALIDFAIENKVNTVLHCFADGRDVSQYSFKNDIKDILAKIEGHKNITLGTISGRYYAMDRDQRWERSELYYQTLLGNANKKFSNPIDYIENEYTQKISDEFLTPAINDEVNVNKIQLSDNDSVIFANFRPDRARQLSHLIQKSSLYEYQPNKRRKNIFLVTMMNYEGIKPNAIAYPPVELKNTLGEIINKNGLSQLRIAETEKYAHVTFFMDGGKDVQYKNEKKILIPSPKVATYDMKPEMSAEEITNNLISTMNEFDFIICNYANGDMVGHTGNMKAAISAMEFVDKCLGMVLKKANEVGMTCFVTADHGNCDEMIDKNNNPMTCHSLAPVFFISTDKSLKLHNGSLTNIAPTILKYLGIDIPKEMTESPLF